jgi:hypothetical protein
MCRSNPTDRSCIRPYAFDAMPFDLIATRDAALLTGHEIQVDLMFTACACRSGGGASSVRPPVEPAFTHST